jgi:AraC-like DNA-binding protein
VRASAYSWSADGPLEAGPGEGQVRAGYLAGFHPLVQRYGGDPRRLLERCGIDPLTLADPDHHIDCAAAVRLLEDCAGLFGDSLFGLRLAEVQTPDVFGCVAAVARAAPTTREGLQAFIDYVPVTHSRTGAFSLVVLASAAEFRWAGHGETETSGQADYQALLLSLKILQMLGGPDVRPDYAHLAFDVPQKDLAEIEARLGCRVEGRRACSGLGFAASLLDRPVISANKLAYRLLGGYLKEVKAAAAANVVARVEAYIRGAMPSGACTIARCARKLGTTVRTLQVQLKDSGASFSDMLAAQRIELAKRQLRRGGSSMHEIAVMLGYSEQAAFGRAFKRWTGVSPRAYRLVDGSLASRQASQGRGASS